MFLIFQLKENEVAFTEASDTKPAGMDSPTVVYEFSSKEDPEVIKLSDRFNIDLDQIDIDG